MAFRGFTAGTLTSNRTEYGNGVPFADQLKLGAGGFITGIDIAPDGVQVMRTDTCGAYTRDQSSGAWRQMLAFDTMPADTLGHDAITGAYGADNFGVNEVCVAPSDTFRFYMAFDGTIYKSTNKGLTWAATALTGLTFYANNDDGLATKTRGRRIAIDPNDEDTAIWCGPAGASRTTNGGTSWSTPTGILAPTSALGGVVAWHPSNSSIVYLGIEGRGVYASSDGGASFTLTTGGPTTMLHMEVGANGVVMCTDGVTTSTNAWKYSGGSWTNLSVAATGSNFHWYAVAPDLNNAGHWYLASDAGQIVYTANDGTSFTAAQAGTRVATAPQPVWPQNTEEAYFSLGSIMFDKSQSNLLLTAQGLGVWKANPPTSAVAFNWNFDSLGVEQLVVNWIDVPPGGTPIVSCWDRAIFKLTADNSAYPADHGPDYVLSILHGWSWDWAKSDPTFCVMIGTRHPIGGATGFARVAYSSNSGTSWTQASGTPSGTTIAGGSVAVATASNWLWCEHGTDSRLRYTNDGGATFSFSTISGVPTSGETGFGVQSSVHRRALCCDDDGYFYVYTNGTGASAASAGIWKSNSPNDGSAFTKVYSDRVLTGVDSAQSYNFNAYNCVFNAMPGVAGKLFFAAGDVGGSISGNFLRSLDAGVTWVAYPDVAEVLAYGFGLAANGTDVNLHIAGWVDGEYGIWVSENPLAATIADVVWSKKAEYPDNHVDIVTCVSGNINTHGVTYIGYRGSGAMRLVWA